MIPIKKKNEFENTEEIMNLGE